MTDISEIDQGSIPAAPPPPINDQEDPRKAIKTNKNSDYGFFNVQRIPITPRSVAEAPGWVEVHRIAIAITPNKIPPVTSKTVQLTLQAASARWWILPSALCTISLHWQRHEAREFCCRPGD